MPVRLSNQPGDHSGVDDTHCDGIATVSVVRQPLGSKTRPHQLAEVQDGPKVQQFRHGAPTFSVQDGTYEKEKKRMWVKGCNECVITKRSLVKPL